MVAAFHAGVQRTGTRHISEDVAMMSIFPLLERCQKGPARRCPMESGLAGTGDDNLATVDLLEYYNRTVKVSEIA